MSSPEHGRPQGPAGPEQPHVPAPTLWPVGFAVGIALILVGLIVDPRLITSIGVGVTVIFGFMWARDAAAEYRGAVHVEPERREVGRPLPPPIPADRGEAAMPAPESEAEIERFPRSRFLEFSTLGLGGLIGGLVTVPILGPMVVSPFLNQPGFKIDLGPITDFSEGSWMIATFFRNPKEGEVAHRTAYIRNNGLVKGEPSFTILSNRCAHLGCPVQPNGPMFADQKKTEKTKSGGDITLIPTLPAGGFGCPCHGGQYDQEGNRTAGPPVRALDRYEYEIKDGRLVLGKMYSVAKVKGQAADAKIVRVPLAGPGEHVDGPEKWFYPVDPPHN